jgi:hypothetical protein
MQERRHASKLKDIFALSAKFCVLCGGNLFTAKIAKNCRKVRRESLPGAEFSTAELGASNLD